MDLEKIAAAVMQNANIQNVHFNDIHDNENVYVGTDGVTTDAPEKKGSDEAAQKSVIVDEELFHFIHPSLQIYTESEVHQEVKNLLRSFGIQEICAYLKKMADDDKILLPISTKVAYEELVRMGMPNGDGYSYKTFEKYYKR